MKQNKVKQLLFLTFTRLRGYIYQMLGLIDRDVLKQTNPISILAYHSVSDDGWRFSIDLKTMKKQIAFLKKNYQFISLRTVEKYINGEIDITKPSIVLTFDDGYKDVLKIKDYLKNNKIAPALFIISNTKNVNRSEIGRKSTYLNKTEIKSLITAGWEIGCHSATHADLTKLGNKQLVSETIIAKESLQKLLGIKINYFAYPRGKYSKKVLQFVKTAGYNLALTMDDEFISQKSDCLAIPRIGIDGTHTFSEFKSTFSPSTIRVRRFIKNTFVRRYL